MKSGIFLATGAESIEDSTLAYSPTDAAARPAEHQIAEIRERSRIMHFMFSAMSSHQTASWTNAPGRDLIEWLAHKTQIFSAAQPSLVDSYWQSTPFTHDMLQALRITFASDAIDEITWSLIRIYAGQSVPLGLS